MSMVEDIHIGLVLGQVLVLMLVLHTQDQDTVTVQQPMVLSKNQSRWDPEDTQPRVEAHSNSTSQETSLTTEP